MKYCIEVDSPVMHELVSCVSNHINYMMVHKLELIRHYGRGSTHVIEYATRIRRVQEGLDALIQASKEAVPERATGIYEGSLQVGDEMPFVYGKPRNDPRTPRVKASNRRRRTPA